MEWIHDENSVVEKHAQTMLQLVKFGIDWKCRELEQIVNIEWWSIPNLYFEEIKVFLG